jgi:peroxiredoxin
VLLRAAKALESIGVIVVAISLDKTWAQAERVFPKIQPSANFVSLLDPTGKSAENWGSYNFPETYLVDKDQKIVTKWIGPQEWESQAFRDFLKPYL